MSRVRRGSRSPGTRRKRSTSSVQEYEVIASFFFREEDLQAASAGDDGDQKLPFSTEVPLGDCQFQKMGGTGVRCLVFEVVDWETGSEAESEAKSQNGTNSIVEDISLLPLDDHFGLQPAETQPSFYSFATVNTKLTVNHMTTDELSGLKCPDDGPTRLTSVNRDPARTPPAISSCEGANRAITYGRSPKTTKLIAVAWNVDRKRRGGRKNTHHPYNKGLILARDGVIIKLCGNAGFWVPKECKDIFSVRIDSGSRSVSLLSFRIESNVEVTAVRCGYIKSFKDSTNEVIIQHQFCLNADAAQSRKGLALKRPHIRKENAKPKDSHLSVNDRTTFRSNKRAKSWSEAVQIKVEEQQQQQSPKLFRTKPHHLLSPTLTLSKNPKSFEIYVENTESGERKEYTGSYPLMAATEANFASSDHTNTPTKEFVSNDGNDTTMFVSNSTIAVTFTNDAKNNLIAFGQDENMTTFDLDKDWKPPRFPENTDDVFGANVDVIDFSNSQEEGAGSKLPMISNMGERDEWNNIQKLTTENAIDDIRNMMSLDDRLIAIHSDDDETTSANSDDRNFIIKPEGHLPDVLMRSVDFGKDGHFQHDDNTAEEGGLSTVVSENSSNIGIDAISKDLVVQVEKLSLDAKKPTSQQQEVNKADEGEKEACVDEEDKDCGELADSIAMMSLAVTENNEKAVEYDNKNIEKKGKGKDAQEDKKHNDVEIDSKSKIGAGDKDGKDLVSPAQQPQAVTDESKENFNHNPKDILTTQHEIPNVPPRQQKSSSLPRKLPAPPLPPRRKKLLAQHSDRSKPNVPRRRRNMTVPNMRENTIKSLKSPSQQQQQQQQQRPYVAPKNQKADFKANELMMTSHESMSIMVRVKAGELTVDQAVELVRRIEGQKHCGVAKDEEIKQEQMSSKSGSRRGKIPGTKPRKRKKNIIKGIKNLFGRKTWKSRKSKTL
mmetsp:Transcript_16792/g.27313  ORF Transcript_16792/g.27313 Transcript_16792/m.27313 type:complete len:944 (+) Transcript_16792:137-2968(+)